MPSTFTAFAGYDKLASGPLAQIAAPVKAAWDAGKAHLLIFDDDTGRQVELDLRGSMSEVVERLSQRVSEPAPAPSRGRPKLGVTSREVTLLPTQWEWLAKQPGGASAALRRLVDQARRAGIDKVREAQEAAHRVMFALAGDLPHFEEASRAFYASDLDRFAASAAHWPQDIRDYVEARVRRALKTQQG